MSRSRRLLLTVLAVLAAASGARAQESPTPHPSPSPPAVSAEGDLRLLGQSWNWFDPGRGENGYAFLGTRLRARLKYRSPDVRALLEVQDVQLSGLPAGAVQPGAVGAMGVGATYYAHIGRGSLNTAGVRQAFLEIGDPKEAQAQLGRFDYSSATEVPAGDPVLDALLNTRLSQRMIGPFGFTEYSRSFDGLRLDVEAGPVHVSGLAARPTQGGFEPRFGVEMDRVFIGNLAATLKRSEDFLPDSTAQAFWTRYDDTRDVPFVDNRPAGLRGRVAAQGGIRLDTFGAHFVTRLGRNGDALVWYAHQTGRWGNLAHEADAFTAEVGYRFAEAPWQPWLRGGYTWFSGDGDPSDGRHGTFYAPLPTARAFARFPFYTLANLRDVFGQVILTPAPQTRVRLDLDLLRLAEPGDLWYVGGGATRNEGPIFGYAGRPSGGASGLATLVGLGVDHTFDDRHSMSFYYGHAFGGDVVRATFPASQDGDFFLLEYDLKFP